MNLFKLYQSSNIPLIVFLMVQLLLSTAPCNMGGPAMQNWAYTCLLLPCAPSCPRPQLLLPTTTHPFLTTAAAFCSPPWLLPLLPGALFNLSIHPPGSVGGRQHPDGTRCHAPHTAASPPMHRTRCHCLTAAGWGTACPSTTSLAVRQGSTENGSCACFKSNRQALVGKDIRNRQSRH